MKLRATVIGAIFRRNFSAYFSGVLGYLFILGFVIAAGFFAFRDEFFTANDPNLDQLTQWYPALLLFFVPAITMSVWADERRSGTDELLFTMPATDSEILLAKYFSVLAVYTVALFFSMTHIFVLSYLGNPDWGLLAATYFGYWIAGAAMLSAGMLASQLTSNLTVAFVLGVFLCSIPVGIGWIGRLFQLGDALEPFSIRQQFKDISLGVIQFTGLLYFVGFTVLMLYLNLVLMSRRHWKSGTQGNVAFQYCVRALSIGVIASSVTAWAGYSTSMRIDSTSEKLFTLAPSTKKILRDLDSERPIEIQAFISPNVPPEYEETRKRLVGLLQQFDDIGGKNLVVRLVDVEAFSPQADEAEKFGINPVRILSNDGGRQSEVDDLFLGAVVISSYDKVVVPFFGKGLPIEYELTRSVQTVADDTRFTVGILRTDAGVLDGSREWRIVTELRKQYEVIEVSPSAEIDPKEFDVLLAAMPSSLTDPEMANLVAYAQTGNPLLVFDDPFPLSFNSGGFGVAGAPRQPKPSPGGGGMFGGGGQPPVPKADGGRATRLMDVLGVQWQYDQVAFDVSNPHPQFALLPAEYVFVTRGGSNEEAFNPDNPVTAGLQEIIVLYGGTIEEAPGTKNEITRLVQTGYESGVLAWEEFVDEGGLNFMSMQQTANPRRNPFRRIDSDAHTLAVQSKGDNVNAIFVSDIDMISDFFFEERTFGNLDITFDNVTFVLNAVDALAGDEAFIELRSRRAKHRTLIRVEEQRREFQEERNEAEREADEEADEELEARRTQLSERVKEIEDNEDLDPIAKRQMTQQAQQTEQQRLAIAEARIDQKKDDKIRRIRAETEKKEEDMERRIQWLAIGLPALPALLMGVIVFAGRWRDERLSVTSARRRD